MTKKSVVDEAKPAATTPSSKESLLLEDLRVLSSIKLVLHQQPLDKISSLPGYCIENGRITYLHLNSSKITVLPPEIGNLTALISLNLAGTRIKTLPQTIGQLPVLNSLNLSYTSITSLPPVLIDLLLRSNFSTLIWAWDFRNRIERDPSGAITALTLDAIELTDLNPEFVRLTSLRTLDLSRTSLKIIPPEVFRLPNLTTLILNENPIKTIPAEIGFLTALTTLSLAYTGITALPLEIRKLTSLKNLDLRATKSPVFIPEITLLTGLITLDLSYTCFTILPPEIVRLKALTTLRVSQSGMNAIPPEICRLVALTTLDLSDCPIRSVPEEIKELKSLVTLNLMGVLGLRVLTPAMESLIIGPALSDLWFGPGCLRRIVRDSSGAITSLDLGGCLNTTLPQIIFHLPFLSNLSLSGTKIPALPPEISQLSKLTKLNLNNTPITTLPHEICKLAALESLNLKDTAIKVIPLEVGSLSSLIELKFSLETLDPRYCQCDVVLKHAGIAGPTDNVILNFLRATHANFRNMVLKCIREPVPLGPLLLYQFKFVEFRDQLELACREANNATAKVVLEILRDPSKIPDNADTILDIGMDANRCSTFKPENLEERLINQENIQQSKDNGCEKREPEVQKSIPSNDLDTIDTTQDIDALSAGDLGKKSSMMAIVSKSVFEKEGKDHGDVPLHVGDCYKTNVYFSTSTSLNPLSRGGDLYLVTVRPGERLWLVAVLESPSLETGALGMHESNAPEEERTGWVGSTLNRTPITDITRLIPSLKFTSGKGISTQQGKLAMSLQTPRTLTSEDVTSLKAEIAGANVPTTEPMEKKELDLDILCDDVQTFIELSEDVTEAERGKARDDGRSMIIPLLLCDREDENLELLSSIDEGDLWIVLLTATDYRTLVRVGKSESFYNKVMELQGETYSESKFHEGFLLAMLERSILGLLYARDDTSFTRRAKAFIEVLLLKNSGYRDLGDEDIPLYELLPPNRYSMITEKLYSTWKKEYPSEASINGISYDTYERSMIELVNYAKWDGKRLQWIWMHYFDFGG